MIHGKYTNTYNHKSTEMAIIDALKKDGALTGAEMYGIFQYHIRKAVLQPAIEKLIDDGKIDFWKEGRAHMFSLKP